MDNKLIFSVMIDRLKKSVFILSVFILFSNINMVAQSAKKSKPNVIIIYTDDLGYGDLSSYGNPTIKTPMLDKMAYEGMKFSQFYVAAPVCTPSRAALLTGSYPKRVGLHKHVLFPDSTTGLNPKEETIADLLKENGYTTACIGKWHLGHQSKFSPLNQGFDSFYGIPFSNDMSKKEQDIMRKKKTNYKYNLPLIKGKDTIGFDPDQRQFTKDFTEKSIAFIKSNKIKPFFLYLAHPMPHVPIYASSDFTGKSIRGAYGDTIEEIDWSVGEIMKTLKSLNIDENTLVLFTSDNGPHQEGGADPKYFNSNGKLKGVKRDLYEGGIRIPMIANWPGKIKPNSTSNHISAFWDFLPTVCEIAQVNTPENIDGISFLPELIGKKQKEHDYLYWEFHEQGGKQAVRLGDWKGIRLKMNTNPNAPIELYNLANDIGEEYNIASKNPEIVKKISEIMDNEHSQSKEFSFGYEK